MTDLSVITVTYNSQKLIEDYLTSLEKNLPSNSEIIVVDSGSTDETGPEIRKIIDKYDFKNVVLVNSDKNIGFGKGCNMAAQKASGKYLLFLNPDTKVKANAIEKLVNYAKENEEIGIIAPKLVEPNGRVQKSVRRLPTLSGAILDYFFGKKNYYQEYAPSSDKPVEVESVVGAAMLIKKDLFLNLKGFSEKYFMYFEDLDLCRKVKEKGLKIIYFPSSEIVHVIGGSFSANKLKWLNDSAKIYHGQTKFYLLYLLLRFHNILSKISK